MRYVAILITSIVLCSTLTGCFGSKSDIGMSEENIFVITTWYHYAGSTINPRAVDATNPVEVKNANLSVNLTGMNIPYFTSGTYYGTGWDTFEPTLGITSSGAIFFTNYNGLGDGTNIIEGSGSNLGRCRAFQSN